MEYTLVLVGTNQDLLLFKLLTFFGVLLTRPATVCDFMVYRIVVVLGVKKLKVQRAHKTLIGYLQM